MAPGSAAAEQLGLTAHYNAAVPLTLHQEKIMAEVTGPSTETGSTASLDLVVVLDTSYSMKGQKLQDMKQAAEFVIKKMGKKDTLSFVPFSSKVGKPSSDPPRFMSDGEKKAASDFVQALKEDDCTNIKDGLYKAISMLHARTDKTGRAAGVFLMTDGEQNIGDARDVDVHDVPVFTFGFGNEHDHNLLYDIARKSHGGTYHNTPHSDVGNSLLDYFAMVLGILRDVSVMNLTVTLTPYSGATILQLEPGNYRVISGAHGSSIIHFGDLARTETRKIIVVIQLPAVLNNEKAKNVMAVECSYRLAGKRESTASLNIEMARDNNAQPDAPRGHFKAELARRDHAKRIVKMKALADDRNYDNANDELAEAKNDLRKIEGTQHSMELLDALSLELEHLEELLESHEVYSQRGSPYMLAAVLSHDCQRFAARGGNGDVMLYALPRMLKYAGQAKEFHTNPNTTNI